MAQDDLFALKLPPGHNRVDYSVIPGNHQPLELTAMSRIKRSYGLNKIHLLPGGAGDNDFNIRIASGQLKGIGNRMRHLVREIMIKKKSNSQRNTKTFGNYLGYQVHGWLDYVLHTCLPRFAWPRQAETLNLIAKGSHMLK
jgi:hypothetical protein